MGAVHTLHVVGQNQRVEKDGFCHIEPINRLQQIELQHLERSKLHSFNVAFAILILFKTA